MRPLEVTVSSGGKFHAYHIARAAQQAGYLRRFITTIYDRYETGIDRSKVRQIMLPELLGMAIQKLPTTSSVSLSYLVRDNLFDLMARRYLSGGDILNVFNHFGLYSMRQARRLGMKTIVERSSAHPVVHHRILSEEYARYGLRYSRANAWLFGKHEQEYAEADAIAVPSEFVWRTMVEQGVPEARLRRVHFGFEPGHFRPMPGVKTDDVFRVMFAGSVSLQKGVQYLLEAFRRLNLPNAELVLVGGSFPDSRAFLPQYEGLYRHIPFVPHPRLAEVYNTASVFVLPSLQDGFGMVVYEAAACGLPVIITENVGADIRDGQDGFVVPIRDPDALADRLLRLYRDENLRREMGRSAWEYVQQFTWEAYHRQVIAHYEELAGYA
ncbi:MAG TPA: glycosyltransferase family 4 protein [Aggregatilineales bacterium]|nr:glycosyltransferase family 4 protein [Chloroflexota bacterium]HOA23108.1 glycosyltransferase family 4 protein [Aggregatilineales bacterium]HQA67353.1 glycosyltransferase family 4 protein [Aggregatilineales bacterium]HQE19530.1 glycosyltransferase family 4 protein [Aggregatilineales bacterium]